jgi:hypothetical protein
MLALDDPRSKNVRSVRAAHASRESRRAAGCGRFGPSRRRRGHLNQLAAEWRRCALGTNHIANLGVWRVRTRRQAPRANRTGVTHWQMRRRALDTAACTL